MIIIYIRTAIVAAAEVVYAREADVKRGDRVMHVL